MSNCTTNQVNEIVSDMYQAGIGIIFLTLFAGFMYAFTLGLANRGDSLTEAKEEMNKKLDKILVSVDDARYRLEMMKKGDNKTA